MADSMHMVRDGAFEASTGNVNKFVRIVMRSTCYKIVILVLLGLALPGVASAQQSERIAAVVNDDIVSTSDVAHRLSLALLALQLPDTQETRQRLLPQIIRDLINEKLQLQEASRLEIEVSEEELTDSFARIAESNGESTEQFARNLRRAGVPTEALIAQLRAQLAWTRVLQRTVRNQIEITDEDVDAVLERLESSAGQPEYLLAEVFLGVDSPSDEPQVRDLAGRLVQQVRGGANFAVIAQQFSEAAGANRGGDLGWVPADQLPEQVVNALDQVRERDITPPIRTQEGYRILLLRDRRMPTGGDVILSLRQYFVAIPEGTDPDFTTRARIARELDSKIDGCAALDARIATATDGVSGDVGEVRLSELPPAIRDTVRNTPVDTFAEPLMRADGMLLVMPCSRQVETMEMPSRRAIAQQLGMERMEILQRRYLRDLRAAAFVEVRV